MGFRTTVVLYNDHSGQWENDPMLGKKIHASAGHAMCNPPTEGSHLQGGYGRVVGCHHADTQVIGVFDSYDFQSIAFSQWRRGEAKDDMKVRMLKEAADALGYRLVKKAGK